MEPHNNIRCWDKLDTFLVVLLFLSAIVIQLLFLKPPALSDQLDYFHFAEIFPDAPSSPSHRSLRLGLIIPAGIMIKIFNYSELAYYLMPVFSFAILTSGSFLFSRALFGRFSAILTGLLILSQQNILFDSSHLLPDNSGTAFFIIASAITVYWVKYQRKWDKTKTRIILTVVGMLLGWAYLTRETVILLFPLIPLLFIIYKAPLKQFIYVVIGVLIIYGIEFSWGMYHFNDPFVRFESASPRVTDAAFSKDVSTILLYFPSFFWKRPEGYYTLLIIFMSLTGMTILSIKKNPEYLFILIWVIGIWLIYSLMGLLPAIFSWDNQVMLRLHKFRYWLPIFTPLMASGIAFTIRIIHWASNKISHQWVKHIFLIFLFGVTTYSSVMSIISISKSKAFVRNGADHYLEFRDYITDSTSKSTIWLDDGARGMTRVIPIYLHNWHGVSLWSGELRQINYGADYMSINEFSAGYFIIHEEAYQLNSKDKKLPEYYQNIPEYWMLTFESENQQLKVYSIPDRVP